MASEQEQMRQKSRLRQVAEERESGFSTTTLKLPEGLKFWKPELGMNTVDIVGYKTGVGNPACPDVGVIWYERTYWRYGDIGPEKKPYIAVGKTFAKPDPIQDWLKRAALDGTQDKKYLDSLKPKQRQLFLVYDRKHPEAGIQLWDFSYHNFGKTLLDVIQASPEERGWDYFYFNDLRGFTLDLTITSKSMGVGSPFKEVSNINFIGRREPLPPHIAEHPYCLDNFLIETPYDVLWRAFHNLPADGSQDASVPGGPAGSVSGTSAPAGTPQTHNTASAGQNSTHGANPGGPVGQSQGAVSGATQTKLQAAVTESPADIRRGIVEMGYAACHNGQTRNQNPYDKGTDRYTWWLEGWMDALEAGAQSKKAEQPSVQKQITAADRGIVKMADVIYNGARHTVFRISDDGATLTLVTDKDDMVPNVPASAVQLTAAASVPPATNAAPVAVAVTSPAAVDEDEWGKDWTN